MRLHYAPGSAHSASVRIALAEKGIEAELHKLNLMQFEQHRPEFVALNRHGTVPVLEDRGQRLIETFLILEYLEDAHPEPPLIGQDARQRYTARKWGKYVETHIAPNLAIVRWAALHGRVSEEAVADLAGLHTARCELWLRARHGFSQEQLAASTQAMLAAAGRLAAELGGTDGAANDWLAGNRFTLADIAVYPHLAQFNALGLAVPRAVEEWLARVAERPSVQAIKADLFPVATMGPELGRWG
jgi:glutathione S-transferase